MPMESIIAACSDWSAPSFMKTDEKFVIRYFVYLEIRTKTANRFYNLFSNYVYYPGYVIRASNKIAGDFYFDVIRNEPITLALTGLNNSGNKLFVIPRRDDIKAFFWPKGDFVGRNIKKVLGGYFYDEIWNNKPYTVEGGELTCVMRKGSNVLLSPEEENFDSSIGKKLGGLVSSKKGYKSKDITDIADEFSSEESTTPTTLADLASSIKKDNPAPSSTLDKNKRKIKVTNPTTPSPDDLGKDKVKSDVIICNNDLKKLYYHFPNIHSPVTVMGLLKKTETQAYWFEPSIGVLEKHKFNFELSSIANKFVVVEIPYKKGKKSGNFPVRFSGIADVQRVSIDKKTAKAISPYDMNILVVGDASSVAISGLEQMEKILTKKSQHKFTWTIDWRNVSANGKWQTSQKIDSFAKLIKKTKSFGKKDKILLTAANDFRNFTGDFEKTVLNTKEKFDFIIWVKHGYQLPLETPKLVGKLIDKVHDKGNIPRFTNGNPHKWLYIISGSMPGKSKALLEEPITRAWPSPGYVNEEKKGRSPRRLLNRPESLAGSLNMIGMRHIKPLPKFDFDPDSLAVVANQAFDSLGLLLSSESIKDLLSSVKKVNSMTKFTKYFSGVYDPTILLNIQSNHIGEPKRLVVNDKQFAAKNIHRRQENHKKKINTFLTKATKALKTVNRKLGADSRCTHIYVKDTKIGLNWLDSK